MLAGHDHHYERFAPIDGIRSFVVGTGGRNLTSFKTPKPGSQVRLMHFGVLDLELRDGSYTWRFLAAPGRAVLDTGSAACALSAAPPPPHRTTIRSTSNERVPPSRSTVPGRFTRTRIVIQCLARADFGKRTSVAAEPGDHRAPRRHPGPDAEAENDRAVGGRQSQADVRFARTSRRRGSASHGTRRIFFAVAERLPAASTARTP